MSKREEEKLLRRKEKLEKERLRLKSMRVYEEEYGQYNYICGIDEAGRGPLAGPVVAGAVILPADEEILYLNDSKKLSEKRREALYTEIMETAVAQETACIRCGRCMRACPVHLLPQARAEAAQRLDYEQYETRLYGLDCIACGSCTYVCPAKRPLMQLFKQTKAAVMAAKRK